MHANARTVISFLPHCKSGQSVSLEVLQRAKTIGGVYKSVAGGHAVLKAEHASLLGCFVRLSPPTLKKDKSSRVDTMEDRKGRFDFMQQQMSPKQ